MTLNDVMGVILRYSTEFAALGDNYVKWLKTDPYYMNKRRKDRRPEISMR